MSMTEYKKTLFRLDLACKVFHHQKRDIKWLYKYYLRLEKIKSSWWSFRRKDRIKRLLQEVYTKISKSDHDYFLQIVEYTESPKKMHLFKIFERKVKKPLKDYIVFKELFHFFFHFFFHFLFI